MRTPLSAQVNNLLHGATAGEVSHGPGGLFLGLEVSLDDVSKWLQDPGIHHDLDLVLFPAV